METLAEQYIAMYLTRGGKVFISPQFSVLGDKPDTEWSCPDFVALSFEDPQHPKVLVVEVSTASDVGNLLKKVKDRKALWFERVNAKLQADGIIDAQWTTHFIGFVREAVLGKARHHFSGENDVFFVALEDATFSWAYWENRKDGLFVRP